MKNVLGEEVRVPPCKCSACGTIQDAASCVGSDAKPSPGDVTVCIDCGHIMAFDDSMKLRELNDEETSAIAGDPRLLALQWARGKAKEKVKH